MLNVRCAEQALLFPFCCLLLSAAASAAVWLPVWLRLSVVRSLLTVSCATPSTTTVRARHQGQACKSSLKRQALHRSRTKTREERQRMKRGPNFVDHSRFLAPRAGTSGLTHQDERQPSVTREHLLSLPFSLCPPFASTLFTGAQSYCWTMPKLMTSWRSVAPLCCCAPRVSFHHPIRRLLTQQEGRMTLSTHVNSEKILASSRVRVSSSVCLWC